MIYIIQFVLSAREKTEEWICDTEVFQNTSADSFLLLAEKESWQTVCFQADTDAGPKGPMYLSFPYLYLRDPESARFLG